MSAIFKKANTAVITGGASGIGLALAQKCVGYGMRVLVADWDAWGLDVAKQSLGETATTMHVDVSKTEDWAQIKSAVVKDFGGQINFLALNAGVGARTAFDGPEADIASFRKVLDVNFFGVVNGITALLPLIKEKTAAASSLESAIVITGSKQGITNPPGNPAYNASKAAVKSLAEQLSYDLRANKGVGVHLLVPGWTWTGLAGASGDKAKPDAPWTPEQVANYLEAKMEEGKFWVLCPDNEVTEEVDRKRMLWSAQDAPTGRPPLSRWREEYKAEFGKFMEGGA
ncbi:NAD(P)-binding protein [Annulohypoxylon maeteangense]|uniref:NAD(P)-binding protein n=1 Tax=Annulohypoxylon maeteangense TaxID=1927788 RepID=UPI0020086E99|nr:NAD(P)-binding protein [Annulohypoxylon maeteangense]KAI0884515.1 NAD(P)-binding protein [Annulohypoxylon maeteangense]